MHRTTVVHLVPLTYTYTCTQREKFYTSLGLALLTIFGGMNNKRFFNTHGHGIEAGAGKFAVQLVCKKTSF
jgi:hypothetical protein